MIDILHVQLHPFLEGHAQGTPTVNLPETGNAGFDAEAAPVPILVEPGVIPQRQWPGAHQAHIPDEHIEELGKFVNAGFPQKPA